MLMGYLPVRPLKGAYTTEPFINDDSQSVLITSKSGFAMELFRSHIGDGTRHILTAQQLGRGRKQGNAKITENDVLVRSKQHILWLDIPVYYISIMSVLECRRNLFGESHCRFEREVGAAWVKLAESSPRDIVHDKNRNSLLNEKFKHAQCLDASIEPESAPQ